MRVRDVLEMPIDEFVGWIVFFEKNKGAFL